MTKSVYLCIEIFHKKSGEIIVPELLYEFYFNASYLLSGYYFQHQQYEPISYEKGLPLDFSAKIFYTDKVFKKAFFKHKKNKYFIGEHGFSYITLAEFLNYQFIEKNNNTFITKSLIPLLQNIKKQYLLSDSQIRIVLGFDF